MSKPELVEGVLDITDKGFGFLRAVDNGYAISSSDPYVPRNIIQKLHLQTGMHVEGSGARKSNSKENIAISKVEKVNGMPVKDLKGHPKFQSLTVIDPIEKLTLETGQFPMTTRMIDIFAPIGKGQRALLVSPPKAGKTVFIEDIAKGIKANYPDIHLIVFLMDERPEESDPV